MGFFASFIMILSESKQGSVELIFHKPLSVDEFSDRKELALAAEAAVFAGLNLR
jgi:1-acyl-sn-glycerol-3-phosphate acyltransferase